MTDEITVGLDEGLALYLQEHGHGTYAPDAAGGSIFVGKLPQTPNECVAIFPTGGFVASIKDGWDLPTIQVRVRGAPNAFRATEQRAQAIYNRLQGLKQHRLANGILVIRCQGMQSAPNYIAPDEADRPEFSINYQLEVRNLSVHRV